MITIDYSTNCSKSCWAWLYKYCTSLCLLLLIFLQLHTWRTMMPTVKSVSHLTLTFVTIWGGGSSSQTTVQSSCSDLSRKSTSCDGEALCVGESHWNEGSNNPIKVRGIVFPSNSVTHRKSVLWAKISNSWKTLLFSQMLHLKRVKETTAWPWQKQ